ncbi:MAG: FAD-binding oxidoreductase [Zoogloeaceae bacterium]|jgi:FAD/FMN-containing dehydrogenase|nr:FAD-binding oxidoreductase [Zoogloeaceae bacterium]
MTTLTPIASFGRRSAPLHDVKMLGGHFSLPTFAAPMLAYGAGKSYGDVCLNPRNTLLLTRGLDRFLAFDENTGILRCEPGVLLADILETLGPRGWTLPVVPGTALITVGGAIANDVHGKSHHLHGTFGRHVERFQLRRSNGETLSCSRDENPELFAATIGGLGLTGLIAEAELRLIPSPGQFLEAENLPFHSLDEFFALSKASADWAYTVSWIDCAAPSVRGLFMRGNPTRQVDRAPRASRLSVPFTPPFSLIGKATVAPFNALYFALGKRQASRHLVHYRPFFFPLDAVGDWNRLYGKAGFYQYQSVVPWAGAEAAIAQMLHEIAAAGEGSPLAVLKTFGDAPSPGLLSFPMPGVTLALDFPDRGEQTRRLFARLDAIVREAKGRLYPAKDARMPPEMFDLGYHDALARFLPHRDPGFSSAFSRRLLGK